MAILVTGATSVIGVPLIERLLVEKYKVYAMVRPNSPNKGNLEVLGDINRVSIIELDLETGDRLVEFIKEPIDVCIHLGWDGAGSENRKKRDVQQKNVDSSMKILTACAQLQCKRFIFSGSQAEYGPCRDIIDESVECHPLSEYAKAKIDFMNLVKDFMHDKGGMQYIHTRIFSIYGPNDHKGSLVNSCIDTFLNGDVIEMGRCEHLWNYLYIDDLVDAYLALIQSDAIREQFVIYNIAGKKEETRPLKEYVQMIHVECGAKGKYLLGARQENAEGAANLAPSIEKIQAEIGWSPKILFDEGIRRILRTRS